MALKTDVLSCYLWDTHVKCSRSAGATTVQRLLGKMQTALPMDTGVTPPTRVTQTSGIGSLENKLVPVGGASPALKERVEDPEGVHEDNRDLLEWKAVTKSATGI